MWVPLAVIIDVYIKLWAKSIELVPVSVASGRKYPFLDSFWLDQSNCKLGSKGLLANSRSIIISCRGYNFHSPGIFPITDFER